MPATGVKISKRPPPGASQAEIIQHAAALAMQKIGKRHVAARRAIVANWRTRVHFVYEVKVTPGRITLIVRATGSAKALRIWRWVDKTGTKPHIIRPRKAGGVLFFTWGGPGSHQAKTMANPARWGGSGTVSNGRPFFRRFVRHKGFAARKMSDAVNFNFQFQDKKELNEGIQQGVKRASGRSR